MASTSTSEKRNPLLESQRSQSLGEYVQGYIRRLVSGDLGSLPIIIGLIVIAIIFQSQNANFLTPRNFVNLILQMSGVTMIAYGVVFVLLLGEIDLSVGYVSAIGGVSVAILLRDPNAVSTALAGGEVSTQAAIFLFLKQWSVILFPAILGGARLLWGYTHRPAGTTLESKAIVQSGIWAVVGVAMSLPFLLSEGWNWFNAIMVAVVTSASIGLTQGLIITIFSVPSFIVTLAGLLAWNGVVLRIIGNGGTVIIQNKIITDIANSYLYKPETGIPLNILGLDLGSFYFSQGLMVLLGFVVVFAVIQFYQLYSRQQQGLSTAPRPIIIGQIVALALIALIVAHICDQDRGVPVVGLILMIFMLTLTFVTRNTQFGRFVYAVGGNQEAARRAGISVTQIRVLVFMISSTLAGVGGIILASRLRSVDTGAGGGNLLLNAIASAVIGGTSLFGGRGHVSSAVLGAMVILSVENGMSLLNLASGDKFVITGIVLLFAVIIDSLSRRRQKQSGIA